MNLIGINYQRAEKPDHMDFYLKGLATRQELGTSFERIEPGANIILSLLLIEPEMTEPVPIQTFASITDIQVFNIISRFLRRPKVFSDFTISRENLLQGQAGGPAVHHLFFNKSQLIFRRRFGNKKILQCRRTNFKKNGQIITINLFEKILVKKSRHFF